MFGSMVSVAKSGLSGNMEVAQQSLRECEEHASNVLKEWGMYSLAAEMDRQHGQGNLSIGEQIEQLQQNMPRDPSY